MRNYIRLVALFVIVAGIAVAYYTAKQATAPESAIITRERERMTAGFDKARAARDPAYEADFRNRSNFLDYRIALAFIKENDPDSAIAALQKLIDQERASAKGGPRRSRSYQNEAGYYDALIQAYDLKRDVGAVERAVEARTSLLARAEDARRKERQEEGKWVGRSGD